LAIAPLILLSGKFAFQAMWFFYPILALVLKSVWFILPIPVGILLALVITGGAYLRILKNHFRFLIFWKSEIQSRYPIIVERVSLRKMIVAIRKLTKEPKECLRIIYEHPVVHAIIHNPFLIMWGIVFFVGNSYRNLFYDLSFWVLAGILTYSAVSFRWLLFIGEPERYLEYAIFPLSILSAYAIIDLGLLFSGFLLLSFSLFIVFIDYRVALNAAVQYGYREFDEVIGYLNSIPETRNILVIPAFYTPQVAYFTHHRAVIFSGNLASSKENEEEFLLVFPKTYEYPNRDLNLLIDKFNLDLIVARRKIDRNLYNFSEYFTCFENKEFSVYAARARMPVPKFVF
jgi:hypothetical protein